MNIRAATIDDIPRVLPMVRAICSLHQLHDPERFAVRPDVLERYAAWLPARIKDAKSIFLVAESGTTTLAGFLVGTVEPEVPIFWVPECGWIHDLWVEPAFRRKGVAHSLTTRAAEHFRNLGIAQVRLHTAHFNDASRALFTQAGFRPCVVEMLLPLQPSPTPTPLTAD
jgi:ribosomal protein S18 acetylase RimI-like enzyme